LDVEKAKKVSASGASLSDPPPGALLQDQWRIQDFCEGDAAGVWGRSPQWGPGAESPVGDSDPPKKAEHFL